MYGQPVIMVYKRLGEEVDRGKLEPIFPAVSMRYEAALFSSSVRFSGLFGGAGVAGGGVGGRVGVEQWILTWHLSLFVPVGLTIVMSRREKRATSRSFRDNCSWRHDGQADSPLDP